MSIEGEFIQRILKHEGNRFLKNQGIAIKSTVSSRSKNLINNRFLSVKKDGAMSGTLTITQPLYARFLDLKALRYGKKKKTVKRKRKIYNRFMYGHKTAITRSLMYGLTTEVIESLKKQIAE